MKFGLIGNPISHSLSPILFRAAYPYSEDTYDLIESHDFEKAFNRFQSEGYTGINITAPYKERITGIGAERDRDVINTGSANTLINRDGRLILYNTDIYGVANSLGDLVSKDSSVLILGYGGAGKAAAYTLSGKGCRVNVVNRTPARKAGAAWEDQVGFALPGSLTGLVRISEIVVNTLPLVPEYLKEADFCRKVILDANYKGENLSYTQSCKGVIYIPGTRWLLEQAAVSFRLFTGREPDYSSMKSVTDNL
ncbi:MAG: hypothetical protein PHP30_02890 [Bacteroidales bacterium]|nr:hypothetical protein [Bacteroidales bacterium]MDD2425994.1 hypothetical protein [Bacteroidales bacterium]MDD3989027.1 hypothetical protein [Bacteroidales bacterium]MDD4638639.1 hypothetical protein [Bacteroidales bacterium]